MEQKHERPDHRRIVLLVACVLAIVGISAMALSEEAEASGAADNWYYDQLPDFPQKLYDASKKITDSQMSYTFYYDTTIMDSNSWKALLDTYIGMAYEALKCEWLGMHILNGPIEVKIVNTTVKVSCYHTGLYTSNSTATREINSALASYEIDTTSRYTTVKSIHDVVCNALTYSDRGLTEMDYSLYNAVVGDNKVVCEGYAKMFKALCDLYNVPCVIVLGQAKESSTAEYVNHMYNYVQMNDGKWYMVDATWDDLDEGTVYTYFLAGSNTDGFFTKVYESHKPGIFGLNPPPLSSKKYEPASLTISYNSATKTMSFDGEFDIPSGDSAQATWTSYSSLVENIVISDDVTAIGDKAFYKFSKLKSVTIGNSVKRIGDRAFANCTSLTSVSIPSSVTSIDDYAFYSCTSLNSLTTSSGLKSIGERAFYGCTGLKTATIANTVSSIGSSAFYGCKFFDVDGTTALSAVPADIAGYKFTGTASKLVLSTKFVVGYEFWKNGLKYQVTSALSKDRQVALVGYSGSIVSLAVPDYVSTTVGKIPVTSIGGKAFYECSTLTTADLGNVDTVGNKAFAYCASLKTITIPSTVVKIGDYAFYKCAAATKLTTSSGLKSIGERAFYGCTGLKTATIANTVSSIGSSAFYGCKFFDVDGTTALSAVPADIAGYKFTGTASKLVLSTKFVVGYEFWKNGLKYQVTSALSKDRQVALVGFSGAPSSLVVPSYVSTTVGNIPVTSIGGKAFYECGTLASADLGSVKTIGNKAFAYCTSLKSITVPSTVVTIGDYAFYKCSSATSLVTSAGLEKIGYRAFYDCTGLKSVTIGKNVSRIGGSAFYGCSFYDADGTTALSAVPEYLAGYKFTGSASKLVLDTKFVVGYEFWKSGLKYQVTSSLAKDRQLAVVGYSGCITSLVVPENVNTSAGLFPVTSIGTKAFYGCTTLKSADIGSVTTIGTKAFAGCSSLETLSTLKNVSSVSSYAFFGCDSLTKVVISGTGSSIGASAFSGCDGLKVVKILGSGISLGDYAFNGCASLSTLNLSGVKTIGFKTFMNCTSITKLALPNVTTITKYAFYGCDSISSIEFGASLKGIGSYAFDGHSFYSSNGKTKLTVTASNLGGHAFSGTPAKLVMTA